MARRAPLTVVHLLRDVAASDGDADAYVEYPAVSQLDQSQLAGTRNETISFGEVDRVRRRLSFGGLDIAADSVAAIFADAGVKKGDIIALLLPSSIDYAVCYHA